MARYDFHQAFVLQLQQSFAYGRAAHAQLQRDFLLQCPVAGRPDVVQNAVTNLFVGGVDQ